MKRGTWIAVLAAILCLAALGGLAFYLNAHFGDTLSPDSPSQAVLDADRIAQSLYASSTEQQTDTEEPQLHPPLIWIGDSRTLGMKEALKNDELYIGAAGEGYEWLLETGLPLVKEAIAAHPETPLVINFGVNDYDNLDNYINLYRSLAEEYPDSHFYFLSVNPIDPELCQNITNEQICDFNDHLKSFCGDCYLDSYSVLTEENRKPFDGIHYEEDDYRRIHDFTVAEIEKKEEKSSGVEIPDA